MLSTRSGLARTFASPSAAGRLTLLMLVALWEASSQNVRPIKDDVGFCWDPDRMRTFMQFLAASELGKSEGDPAVAAIVPHDDYLYAGRVAYQFFRDFRAQEVLIFGVTHGTVRKEIGDPRGVIILDRHTAWRGLGREVAISPLRGVLAKNLDSSDVLVSDRAHALEHSIEALVPYLQYFQPDIRITPVMVTAMPWERMQELSARVARITLDYCRRNDLAPGRDFVMLISSDANHYGADFNNTSFGEGDTAHTRAVAFDRELVDRYLQGGLTAARVRGLTETVWRDPARVVWCGKYSVPFGLLVAEGVAGRTLRGELLRYGDTYSGGVLSLTQTGMGLTAPFSLKHWVGFFAVVYR